VSVSRRPVWTQRIGSVIHQPRVFVAAVACIALTVAALINPAAVT
jgi:hypothetical protein